jgi:hypothetical protein
MCNARCSVVPLSVARLTSNPPLTAHFSSLWRLSGFILWPRCACCTPTYNVSRLSMQQCGFIRLLVVWLLRASSHHWHLSSLRHPPEPSHTALVALTVPRLPSSSSRLLYNGPEAASMWEV